MSKSVRLDRIDIKILNILQSQGRITNQSLADEVGLSPSPCLQRVKRLEEAGVISSYMAQLEVEKICYRITVLGTVTLQDHRFSDFKQFEQLIHDVPEIVECAKVSGAFDYLLKFECPSIEHYHELTERLLETGEGMFRISSHVVLSHTKKFHGFPLENLIQGD